MKFLYVNLLTCQVDILGCTKPSHKGTGVRQGDISEFVHVDTMAHAINDRTVIMSVGSLKAVFFLSFFCEHALWSVKE